MLLSDISPTPGFLLDWLLHADPYLTIKKNLSNQLIGTHLFILFGSDLNGTTLVVFFPSLSWPDTNKTIGPTVSNLLMFMRHTGYQRANKLQWYYIAFGSLKSKYTFVTIMWKQGVKISQFSVLSGLFFTYNRINVLLSH